VADWRVGILGSYSNTSLNVQGRSSVGSSDIYHLGLYGGTQAGPVAVRLGGAYSWHGLNMARAVAFSDQLASQYNGGTTQLFGEAGYKLDVNRINLEPFANLAYVDLGTSGFKETGGASALSVAGTRDGVTFTTLGLHASRALDWSDSGLTARGSLGWRHAFGDVTPVSSTTFLGGDSSFAIDGVPVAQDSMALEAGIDAVLSRSLTIGLGYTGQFASGARDNGVKGSMQWTW
jgi:outer membrane autotransporter protein